MAEIRTCQNCSRPINVPPHALNKRFCSDSCRNDYHNGRARRAKELLAEQERKEGQDEL